jgi:hypothetical protein
MADHEQVRLERARTAGQKLPFASVRGRRSRRVIASAGLCITHQQNVVVAEVEPYHETVLVQIS